MQKFFVLFVTVLLAVAASSQCSFAQFSGGLKYVSTAASASPKTVHRGGKTTVTVSVDVISGFHINSIKPNDPDLIPTSISLVAPTGIKVGAGAYPKARTINAPSLSQKPLSVYIGANKASFPITVESSAKPGQYLIPVTIQYQGCNASSCFPPKTDHISVTVQVN